MNMKEAIKEINKLIFKRRGRKIYGDKFVHIHSDGWTESMDTKGQAIITIEVIYEDLTDRTARVWMNANNEIIIDETYIKHR